MRLAEALNLRADINKRISQLGERLRANAKVQEGDTPAENPEELLAELDRLTAELEELMGRINLTQQDCFRRCFPYGNDSKKGRSYAEIGDYQKIPCGSFIKG